MLKLPKPQADAREAFETCISAIRNVDLRNRLNGLGDLVAGSSELLNNSMINGNVVDVNLRPNTPNIEPEDLKSVYKHHFARKGSKGRKFYDEIMVAAPGGKCPLCAQRNARTLDHFMPQSGFPILSVVPLNLVPACYDCNKDKLDAVPLSEDQVALHPYYDDIESDVWLIATIVETCPPTTVFSIGAPQQWTPVLVSRIRNQFDRLKLASLYSIEAAAEFSHIRRELNRTYDAGGPDAVRHHLQKSHNSCLAHRTNSWRTAAYLAWLESDWFCNLLFEQQ